MKKLLIMLIILATTQQTKATNQEILMLTLIVIDWGQTLDIAKSKRKYKEKNPLYTKNPTTQEVNTKMAASLATAIIIHKLLDKPYKIWFANTIILTEIIMITNNHQIGLVVNF